MRRVSDDEESRAEERAERSATRRDAAMRRHAAPAIARGGGSRRSDRDGMLRHS